MSKKNENINEEVKNAEETAEDIKDTETKEEASKETEETKEATADDKIAELEPPQSRAGISFREAVPSFLPASAGVPLRSDTPGCSICPSTPELPAGASPAAPPAARPAGAAAVGIFGARSQNFMFFTRTSCAVRTTKKRHTF